jgi:multicomponent Na+:H+ antiporter subunit A
VLGGTDAWLWSVTSVGAATMLFGAVLAIGQYDLKRVLAYSTVSALGMLMMLLGLGSTQAIAAAMTFLLAHALYKGALFLVAGSVDHGSGTRHIERLSGLARKMPITTVAALAAAASMASLPPLFGFIAKELLLESTLAGPTHAIVTGLSVFASMLFVAIAIVLGVRPFFGTATEHARKAYEVGVSLWLGPIVLAVLSVGLGILPQLVDEPLLARASQAVLAAAAPSPLKLALWHGWNDALALSIFAVIGGGVAYAARRWIRIPPAIAERGPAWWYELALSALNFTARCQTAFLQSGYLRRYLLTILVAVASVLAYAIVTRLDTYPDFNWTDVLFHEALIVALVAIATFAAVHARSSLSAIAGLGGVGYCVALLFVLYGAPDLAMTQFLVETMTVILFVLVFYHLPPSVDVSGLATRIRDAVVAIAVGGGMTTLVLLAVQTEADKEVSTYYATHSVDQAHGRNIVNVILVDFRSLDTLGEITVLAVAGIGVYALLKLRWKGGSTS